MGRAMGAAQINLSCVFPLHYSAPSFLSVGKLIQICFGHEFAFRFGSPYLPILPSHRCPPRIAPTPLLSLSLSLPQGDERTNGQDDTLITELQSRAAS